MTTNQVPCSILPGAALAVLAGFTLSLPLAGQCVSGLGATTAQIVTQDWSASNANIDLSSVPLVGQYVPGGITVSFGGASPLAAASVDSVFVLNSTDRSIFHIFRDGDYVATQMPGSGYSGIRYVAGELYAWGGNNLYALSLSTTPINLGAEISSIAFDGQYLWVATSSYLFKLTPGALTGNSPVLPTVVARYPVIVNELAFDGEYLWAALGSGMAQIDTATGTPVARVSITHPVSSLTFDGYFLWLGDPTSSTISKMDVASKQVINLSTGTGPAVDIAFDGLSIWVANAGSSAITKLRACDGSNRGSVSLIGEPAHIAFDGAHKWITYSNSHIVSIR